MLIMLIIFISGLFVDSFLNVVICRLPEGESIVFPRSHCRHCKKELGVADLIPVFSYLFLRGKCRYCGERISIQYPLVELLTGIVFATIYLIYGINTYFISYLIFVCLLIPAAIIDFKHFIIPNKISIPGIVLGAIISFFFLHNTLLTIILDIIIPGGLLLMLAVIYKKGLGMGDVKLIAMVGVFLGWQRALLGLFLGSFIGLLISIVLIIIGVMKRDSKIPFGPYIGAGSLLALFIGENILFLLFGF